MYRCTRHFHPSFLPADECSCKHYIILSSPQNVIPFSDKSVQKQKETLLRNGDSSKEGN